MNYYIVELTGTNTDPGSTTCGSEEKRIGIIHSPSFPDAVHRSALIWEKTYFSMYAFRLIGVVDRVLEWDEHGQ